MRESLQCPKCQSRRIGHFAKVLDHDGKYGDQPRALARKTSGTLWSGMETVAAEVEAYCCTDCGYLEEYVRNPEGVAWEALPGFEWANE